ncbi:hypothetical protein SLEP1_g14390 [Rubroshorea leprosula]|uniref:Uncharacterized protein n=1 Tax=Rubroshorea leprosula TaxID=152421 RepID=A0AAV5ITB9_9ROSI|nr:hypothetical protein SLEP1_g14390 [Rubroshorea leprosula]
MLYSFGYNTKSVNPRFDWKQLAYLISLIIGEQRTKNGVRERMKRICRRKIKRERSLITVRRKGKVDGQ